MNKKHSTEKEKIFLIFLLKRFLMNSDKKNETQKYSDKTVIL